VEYVLALLFDATRPRLTINQAIDSRQWNDLRECLVGPRQVSEMTIGLLGLGRVGGGVGRALSSLASAVIYNDLLEIEPGRRWGARPVSLEELFSTADVLSLHVDGRAANRGFVGESLIRRMKPDATLINTSRGFVVDASAVAAFLRDCPRAKAMLDVHDPEPFDQNYPLLGLANTHLYPHLASRTCSAMRNMSWVVRDVLEVLVGQRPRWPAP
jgi:D-3-phosphoglycerate dehydrogenase